MTMKTKIYILIIAFVGVLFGCTKDFKEMNINPYSPTPETVDPALQLTYLEKWGAFGNADLQERIKNLYGDMFAQYYMDTWFTSCNYVNQDGWQLDYWPQFWVWINSVNIIINQAQDNPKKANVLQIARIYKVYLYSIATDLFGDLPYLKAADGTGINPPYDSQETIYKSLLAELKDAVSKLDPAKDSYWPSLATNDLIYKGSSAMWIKFGNSLRLRLAMRCSQVDAALAKTNAEEAVAGGVFQSGDQYPGIPPSNTQWGMQYPIAMYAGWGDLCLTESMYNILNGTGGLANSAYAGGFGDPRGTKFFTTMSGSLKPMKAGLSAASRATDAATMSLFSRPNVTDPILDQNRYMCLFPVSEAYFLRAEGAVRGWSMGGTAKQLYETGITVSMKEEAKVTITDADLTNYLASTTANTNGVSVVWDDALTLDQKLDKILTQKYIAGFPDNSFEAWADHRRLLKPYLVPVEDPMNTGVVQYSGGTPTFSNYNERILYPSTEAINNPTEYGKVKAKDKITTPLWWTGR